MDESDVKALVRELIGEQSKTKSDVIHGECSTKAVESKVRNFK